MRIDVKLDQFARGILVLRRRQEAALNQIATQQQSANAAAWEDEQPESDVTCGCVEFT